MSYDTVIYIIRMTFDYHKDLIRTCLIVELRIACKLRYQLRDAARILPNDCRSCGHGARVTRRYFYRSCRCDFDTEMDFDIFCHFGAFCNIWPTFFHYVHSYMATSRHQCLHVCFLMVLIWFAELRFINRETGESKRTAKVEFETAELAQKSVQARFW